MCRWDLTHQMLTARMDSGKQLAPSGWIFSLVHTVAPPFLGQSTPFERDWPSRMIDH